MSKTALLMVVVFALCLRCVCLLLLVSLGCFLHVGLFLVVFVRLLVGWLVAVVAEERGKGGRSERGLRRGHGAAVRGVAAVCGEERRGAASHGQRNHPGRNEDAARRHHSDQSR